MAGKKDIDNESHVKVGDMVMWSTSNGSGNGIVIAAPVGDFVMVGEVPGKVTTKEFLLEGPFNVKMCRVSTLFVQPTVFNSKALRSGD